MCLHLKIHHVVIFNIFNDKKAFINIILLFSNKCFILFFFLHDKKNFASFFDIGLFSSFKTLLFLFCFH